MARVPSEGSIKEEPLSPFDQRDNPYDAASSAIHGPTRPMSRKRTTETQISRGLDWIVPHDVTEKRVSPIESSMRAHLMGCCRTPGAP